MKLRCGAALARGDGVKLRCGTGFERGVALNACRAGWFCRGMLGAGRALNEDEFGRATLRLSKLFAFRIALLLLGRLLLEFIGRGTLWFAKLFAVRTGLLF